MEWFQKLAYGGVKGKKYEISSDKTLLGRSRVILFSLCDEPGALLEINSGEGATNKLTTDELVSLRDAIDRILAENRNKPK